MSLVNIERKGKIALFIINRPSKKNSLTMDVVKEINDALDSIEDERVIVFKGEGRFFSAGADISQFKDLSSTNAQSFSTIGNRMMDRIENFGAISIAIIEGGAYGGGLELALSCDFRIASPSTKIGLTEINLGIFPGWGGLKRLKSLTGAGTARFISLTGMIMTGREAYERGIISKLSEDPVKEGMELANRLSEKSKQSIIRIKKLLGQESYNSELEAQLFGEIVETEEAKESVNKFLNR